MMKPQPLKSLYFFYFLEITASYCLIYAVEAYFFLLKKKVLLKKSVENLFMSSEALTFAGVITGGYPELQIVWGMV